MSHYLAELILEARTLQGEKQKKAEANASNLILKIWSRREVLPGDAYPLKRLAPVLKVLEILNADASPFYPSSGNEFERLLSEAYSQLRGLIAFGCLVKYAEIETAPKSDASVRFLSEDETRAMKVLALWLDSVEGKRRTPIVRFVVAGEEGEAAPRESDEGLSKKEKATRAMQNDIERLMATLVKLK